MKVGSVGSEAIYSNASDEICEVQDTTLCLCSDFKTVTRGFDCRNANSHLSVFDCYSFFINKSCLIDCRHWLTFNIFNMKMYDVWND